MTTSKPKTTHKTKLTHEPKKRYTSFYLFMLVIGVCSVVAGTVTITDIPRLVEYYTQEPVYVSLMLLNYVAFAAAAVGLVYLFQKKHLGLVLMLGSLAAQFVLSCILFFFVDQIAAYTVVGVSSSDLASIGGREGYVLFMKTFMQMAIPLGLMVTVGLAVAWHYAWQKQYQADHPSHEH